MTPVRSEKWKITASIFNTNHILLYYTSLHHRPLRFYNAVWCAIHATCNSSVSWNAWDALVWTRQAMGRPRLHHNMQVEIHYAVLQCLLVQQINKFFSPIPNQSHKSKGISANHYARLDKLVKTGCIILRDSCAKYLSQVHSYNL